MAVSRRNKVAEYECTTCRLVIFGDNLSLSRHEMHKGKSRKNCKDSKYCYYIIFEKLSLICEIIVEFLKMSQTIHSFHRNEARNATSFGSFQTVISHDF